MKNGIKIILWLLINLMGVAISKYFLRPIKCSSKLRKYFRLKDNNILIKHAKKTPIKEISDNESLITFALTQFYFANIYNRMNSYYKLLYLIPLYGSIFLFGLAGEIIGLQYSLSNNSIKNWSLPFKILVVCFGLILTILLLGNMYIAFLKNNLFFYLLALILIVIYYFIVYQFYLKDYNYPIHFHHWFIGYVLSFFFCFDNWWNNFTYSILYGIFIEGLVYYGPTSIFKD